MSAKVEVDIPECPVHSVVVYPDRAEVTRVVKVDLEKGSCEVLLKKLSKALDKDSIRVDGIGPASITEVSFQDVPVTEEEDRVVNASTKVADLEQRLDGLVSGRQELEEEDTRLDTQTEFLKSFSDHLISAGGSSTTASLADPATVDGVLGFLDTYVDQCVEVSMKKYETEQKKLQLESEIVEVRKSLSGLRPVVARSEKPATQPVIGILLDVKEEEADVQLLVSYLVSSASWRPRYDLRVSSKARTMEVGYFGTVQQNTGEDWLEARLSLSTAKPSIGGCPPKLDTAHLNLIPDIRYAMRSASLSSSTPTSRRKTRQAYGYGEDARTIETAAAKVTEGLSSSVFTIATATTVPSDNTGHKVAIATIHLEPTFEYDIVPQKVQHAFLRAKVTNSSEYPLLEGVANVYLDQSYVTETTLGSVAPQEELSCSLGVDQSVRVVYRPVKRLREESGLISRTVNYTYCQETELHNTRTGPAKVYLTDQLPRSEDEKLKVTLVEPVLPKQKAGAPLPYPHLSSTNNVVWCLELGPSQTHTVTLRYTVEFPANKRVDGL